MRRASAGGGRSLRAAGQFRREVNPPIPPSPQGVSANAVVVPCGQSCHRIRRGASRANSKPVDANGGIPSTMAQR
jgi:hypothetical protein